jgi:hypothetical protein
MAIENIVYTTVADVQVDLYDFADAVLLRLGEVRGEFLGSTPTPLSAPCDKPLTWAFVERTTGLEPATLTLAR